MAAVEQLCQLLNINPRYLTPQENLILEVELFIRICEELKEFYKAKNKEYFILMNVSHEKENAMLEAKFLRFVINDILMTEDYSIAGIAYHTQIHEDVISDIASGKNKTPTLHVSRKIIELHRAVRPDLYKEVVKKITTEYLAAV
jgi:hypothetical protein